MAGPRPLNDFFAHQKHFLRAHFRRALAALSPGERRVEMVAITRRIAGWRRFQRARIVAVYLSLPSEADTRPVIALCRKAGKSVAVPVVEPRSKSLTFALWKGEPLAPNVYGILEPRRPTEWAAPSALDLVIVPGAAYTRRRERLGSGGGYFDRLLAQYPRLPTAALAHACQLAARLPREAHDRRIGALLTASAIL